MMKTPDEIKKALECCFYDSEQCGECPYYPVSCDRELVRDAREYIRQLEATVSEREKVGEKLAWDNGTLIADNGQLTIEVVLLRAKVEQLEAQVPRWISVEDEQKPKHHEEVLCRYVFDGDSECFYAVLTYYAYGDNGYVTGMHFTGEGLHDMRVTHWMPLPEPLKED